MIGVALGATDGIMASAPSGRYAPAMTEANIEPGAGEASSGPVLIAGGGIGGLTAALALERSGIPWRVFERSPAPREIGSGITLWSNALAVLRALDLDELVIEAGTISEAFDVRLASDRVLATTDLTALTERLGAPSVCLHRADLLGILADAVGRDRIECGRSVQEYSADAEGVRLRFRDGEEVTGSLLIGADGIGSVVRAQLHGAVEPSYRGYTCWRGVAACEPPGFPPGQVREIWAPGIRIGLNHCGRGQVFFYATANRPAGSPVAPAGHLAELRSLLEGFPAPTGAFLDAMDPDQVLRHDIVDRPPLWRWGRGRVSLLGDAAHPTTPNWGQGACQALEDAWVLADELGSGITTAALRRYEGRRRRRAAWVVWNSWYIGYLGQLEWAPARWCRDTLVRAVPGLTTFEFERMMRRGIHELRL